MRTEADETQEVRRRRRKRPSRRVLLLFILVGLLSLAQLGWWVLFQVKQSAQFVETRRLELIARCYQAAWKLQGVEGLQPGPLAGEPDLVLIEAGTGIEGPRVDKLVVAVRPAAFHALERWRWHKLVMFMSEGGAFLLLVLLGLGLIYSTLRREVELERLQSNFVAAVTHELKSPLSALRLYLESFLLGRVSEREQRLRYTKHMLEELERLERLIENLLAVGRLDRRRGQLHSEVVELGILVETLIEEQLPALERAGARVDCKVARGVWVRFDEESLRIVLRNLLDNAVQYHDGEPQIQVRLRSEGKEALLEVEDRGIGVEPKELERIFERFYRVGDEMVRSIRGTGLGLYLVKELVEAHGGRVWAESEGLSRGLRVVVRFPLVQAPLQEKTRG